MLSSVIVLNDPMMSQTLAFNVVQRGFDQHLYGESSKHLYKALFGDGQDKI